MLAGICGGYALSEIFVLSADTKELSPIGIIFFIVGAIITTVVYGAVTNRGFKRFKKSIVLGVASALVYGVIAIIVASGAFGFEKRIPEKKAISSVVVDFDDAFINFNDADKALKLHKAIIEKKADDEYLDTVDTPHTYVRINYNLDKDGKDVLMREYFVDKVKIKKELFDVYSSDERFTEFEKGLERVKGDGEVLQQKLDKTKFDMDSLSQMNDKLGADISALEAKLSEIKTNGAGINYTDPMYSKINEKADYAIDKANALAELSQPGPMQDYNDVERLADKYDGNNTNSGDGMIDISGPDDE